MTQTSRKTLQILSLGGLLASSAHAQGPGIDWGQVVVTSINNLVGNSGGAFVHNGVVMVAWVGLAMMLGSIIKGSLAHIDGFNSFRVHVNFSELLVIAFKMWLLVQFLNYYMVPFPGTNLSIHHLPMYISDNLVATLNQGQLDAMQTDLNAVAAKMPHANVLLPLDALVFLIVLVWTGILSFVTFMLTSFGYIGEAVLIVFWPLFFWCALTKTFFSWFWNCFQGMCAFAAYRVIASVILYILADMMIFFFTHGVGADYSFGHWMAMLPIVILLMGLFIIALFMVPLIAASIFNGAGAIGQQALSIFGGAVRLAAAA